MLQTIVVVLFVSMLIIAFLLSIFDVLGASIYDIQQLKKLKKTFKKAQQYNPRVSIVIPAFNEQVVILKCLTSIAESTYANLQVIVSDDASSDNTSKIVRSFISTYDGTIDFQLITNRKNRGRGGAINQGIRKRATGKLIYALDADCTIDSLAIENATRYFSDPTIAAVASNVSTKPHASILGVLQQFEWISSFRSKKINSVLNSEYIIGGAGAMYRRSTIEKLGLFDESMLTEDIALSLSIASSGNKHHKLHYASDVEVLTAHVPNYVGLYKQRFRWKLGSLQALYAHRGLFFSRDKKYTKTLTFYRLPVVLFNEVMLLLEPLFIAYFIYLALVLNTPIFFVIGWIGSTTMFFFALWGDDRLHRAEKIRLTLFLPVMYLLYYVLSTIQVLAVVHSLLQSGKITGRKTIKGAWTPPKRLAEDTV